MKKLTNKLKSKHEEHLVTNKNNLPFIISFKYKLPNNYNFKGLNEINIKDFQKFLDRVAGMTWSEVDNSYARNPDHNDEFDIGNNVKKSVVHYEIKGKFRIHGVVENSRLKVIRIDPNHKFHR